MTQTNPLRVVVDHIRNAKGDLPTLDDLHTRMMMLQDSLQFLLDDLNKDNSFTKVFRVYAQNYKANLVTERTHGSQFVTWYAGFLKDLNTDLRKEESQCMLGSFVATMTLIQGDLDEALKTFKGPSSVFVGYTGHEHDVTMSHAVTISYLIMSETIYDAFMSALHLIQTKMQETPPRYHLERLNKSASVISGFSMMLRTRGRSTLFSHIQSIRQKNKDHLIINASGATIDEYIQVSDLTHLEQTYLMGFADVLWKIPRLLNPLAYYYWIGSHFISSANRRHERRKADLKWAKARITVLAMELDGKDPSDPEYIKIKKICDYYEDMVTRLDQQIQRYEQVK